VRDHELPAGVTSLSGIALDDGHDRAIVSGTGGKVWILHGVTGRPVLTIRLSSATQIEVCWNTRAGVSYNLQRRASFAAETPWENIASNVPGLGATLCRTESLGGPLQTYYYRVEVIP